MDDVGQSTSDAGTVVDIGGKQASAAPPSQVTSQEQPFKLGRYEVSEPLGRGGFATVYGGYDPELDRRVAIKVLRSTRATDEAAERMIREAQALAKLRQPNVVQIFDVGFTDGGAGRRSAYIVMELLPGPTLGDWVEDEKPGEARIISAYVEAAKGLAAAHAVGVVHRDFKPSNAMFGADGRVKVLDFGLAQEHTAGVRPPNPKRRAAGVTASKAASRRSRSRRPGS